jgi:ParB family chromosome partitioning protein
MNDKPSFLPVDQLQPNPLQPRGAITPESLADLVESIRVHGVIEPIVVAHTPAGYQIIAGERRWRASRLAGLQEVPVLIKETTPRGMLEMAIVENVQRTDLNAIDRAKSFERLIQEFNLTHSEVAGRIGKSESYVSNTMRMLDLPDALKDGLITAVISEGHARALMGIKEQGTMIEAYKIILKENGSVRRAEELARRMRPKSKDEMLQERPGAPAPTTGTQVDLISKQLQEILGENARVNIRRSRQETAIHIVFRGNPKYTEEQIQYVYRALTGAYGVPISNQSKKD